MLLTEKQAVGRFLLHIGVILITLLSLSVLVFFLSKDKDAYGQAIVPKMNALEVASSGPKLILVGGSGLAFGIDSPKLQKELNMTPVNLGLYAGIGMDPLLSMVEEAAQKDDVVVLIPEYQLLEHDPYGEGFMLLEMMQASPHFAHYLHLESLRRALLASPNWLKTRVESLIGRTLLSPWRKTGDTLYHRVYRAENFNTYGDMEGHLTEVYRFPKTEIESSSMSFVKGHVDGETRVRIVQFLELMKERGVTVLFSWQAIPETTGALNQPSIDALKEELEALLGSAMILGTQADFTFPDNAFFDTVNHLAGPARQDRTDRLAQALKTVILPK